MDYKILILIGTTICSNIFTVAHASNRCPDLNGIFIDLDENRERSSTVDYWVIPIKKRSSINVYHTLKNLVKTNYMSRNKARFTCKLNWRYIQSADPEISEICINRINGSEFDSKGPHESYRGIARHSYSYPSRSFRIPDAKGQIVDAKNSIFDAHQPYESSTSCLLKSKSTVWIYGLVDPVTDEKLPYLLLMRTIVPLKDVIRPSSTPNL